MKAVTAVSKLRYRPTTATWQGPRLALGLPNYSFYLKAQGRFSTAEAGLLSKLPDLADRGFALERERGAVS